MTKCSEKYKTNKNLTWVKHICYGFALKKTNFEQLSGGSADEQSSGVVVDDDAERRRLVTGEGIQHGARLGR